MAEINFGLLQPVDTGALTQQGFSTGMALVKHVQTQNALRAYIANPDDPHAQSALAAFDPDTLARLQKTRADEQALALKREQIAAARAAGAQGATGDYTGAQRTALASGDTDLAAAWGKLQDEDKKKTAEFWQQAGSVAFRLKGLRSPQERTAYWQEARPVLEAQGAPKELLDKIDPNNIAQLDAAVTTAQKVGDLWTQSQPKIVTTEPGGGAFAYQNGALTNLIVPNPGDKPMGAPAEGGGGGGGFAPGPTNPGALRKPGSMEFQRFGSPEEGVSAQHAQLNRYLGRGINTIDGIVETYAPRESKGGDNTDAQVNNYKAYVAQRTGIDPSQPISPAQVPVVAKAMREFETGHRERLAGAHDAGAIRAAANRAIAAGADPQKVRERAAAQGVTL